MSNELTKQSFDLAAPQEALTLANTLKKFATEQGLTEMIDGKPYPKVEAWQFAGSQFGLYPLLIECKNESSYAERTYNWTDRRNNPKSYSTLHYKYRATVEIRRLIDDKIVSRGQMSCTNDERIKHTFDEYAVESMAQTRAEGKAWRMLLAWLMKAAGFEQTPAEEMEEQKETSDNCPSANEKKELIRLAMSAKMNEDQRVEALATIYGCSDYNLFQRIENRLRDLQPHIDEIVNPSQTDIKNHVRNISKQPA